MTGMIETAAGALAQAAFVGLSLFLLFAVFFVAAEVCKLALGRRYRRAAAVRPFRQSVLREGRRR